MSRPSYERSSLRNCIQADDEATAASFVDFPRLPKELRL